MAQCICILELFPIEFEMSVLTVLGVPFQRIKQGVVEGLHYKQNMVTMKIHLTVQMIYPYSILPKETIHSNV